MLRIWLQIRFIINFINCHNMLRTQSAAFTISFPKDKLLQMDTQRGDIPRSRFLLRLWEKTFNKENKEETR